MNCTKICDGLVVIRQFLSPQQQNEILEKLINPMIEEKLFWNEDKLNFMEIRGRYYCGLNQLQCADYLQLMCHNVMEIVQGIDETMPNSIPTHLLTLYYAAERGMGWHRDAGSNDGDLNAPVISFTVGNSCIFDYKLNKIKHSIQLDSGDVIIFGGDQRLMYHRVKRVLIDTKPLGLNLKDQVRINLTFRQATSVIGKEDQYTTEKYVERINTRNDK